MVWLLISNLSNTFFCPHQKKNYTAVFIGPKVLQNARQKLLSFHDKEKRYRFLFWIVLCRKGSHPLESVEGAFAF
jgi:hypothetical protein